MKQTQYDSAEQIFIENMAREICNYDEASLLREAQDTETELRMETSQGKDVCEDQEMEAQFQKLKIRIQKEGLHAVDEKQYIETRIHDNQPVLSGRKTAALIAALFLLFLGGAAVALKESFGSDCRNPWFHSQVDIPSELCYSHAAGTQEK